MANWKYRLNIKDDWQAAKRGEISVVELVQRILPKLKALPPFQSDDELISIVDELEDYASSSITNVDDFDAIWESLYDWADQCVGGWADKMCWIATF